MSRRHDQAVDSTVTDNRTWDYQIVECRRVVDGDTFDLTVTAQVDFGFRLIEDKRWTTRFRLLGGDAFELNEAGGSKARSDALNWISIAIIDKVLRGQTFKTDNFGRWLIDLYRTDTGEHLVDFLRSQGSLES